MKLDVLVFGPGFASGGERMEAEADEAGLRLKTATVGDGAPRWDAIELRKTGWDGAQLRLEWQGKAGMYSLLPQDPAAAKTLAALAKGKSTVRAARPDVVTRSWSHGLIWGTVVLPLLLVAAVIWQHDRIAAWAVGQIGRAHV